MSYYKKSVMLLGKSSIGKTSLLASVYQALKENKDLNFDLSNGEELEAIYNEMTEYAKSLADDDIKGNSPTTELREFKYTISVDNRRNEKNKKNCLDIVVYDVPGEKLRSNRKNKENKDLIKIQECFNSSSVIIVVISSPSLMEDNAIYHEFFNQPGILSDFVNSLPDKIEESKEFIFVPIKCEKYENKFQDLKKTIKDKYSDIISEIVRKGHICSYLPVETLGCVEFKSFSSIVPGEPDSLKEFYSLKDKNNISIYSKNSDVLGAYILNKFIEPYKSIEPLLETVLGNRINIIKNMSSSVELLKKPTKTKPPKFIPTESSGGCLHSNTKISLFDGSLKQIGDIKPGEKVLSFNKNTGLLESQVVTKLVVKTKVNFLKLVFDDGEEILATYNHLFYTDKGWFSASELKTGNILVACDIEGKLIHKTICEKQDNCCNDICYNIYVSKNSNYFANGVLVSSISVLRPLREILERIRFYFIGGEQ